MRSQITLLTKFKLGPIGIYLKMHRNCLTDQRPGYGRISAKRDQKLIISAVYLNGSIHQVWDRSPKWFVLGVGGGGELTARYICMSLSRWRIWRQVYLSSQPQIMIHCQNYHRKSQAYPWSRYGDSLCEMTELHVIKMWSKQNGCNFLEEIVLFKKNSVL